MRGRGSTLLWILVAALLVAGSNLVINVASEEVLARRWWKGPMWLLISLILVAEPGGRHHRIGWGPGDLGRRGVHLPETPNDPDQPLGH